MNFFKKIDMLGSNVYLRYNMETTIKTTFGGIATVFTMFLLGGMLFGFGQDFFKRTNPTFIQKTINPTDYPFWYLNNLNFTYAFTLEDTNGLPQRDFTLFYYTFTFNRYKKNQENIWEMLEYYELNTTNCTANLFSDPNQFYDKGLDIWLCPILDNIKLGGYWDSDEVSYLRIDVHRCLEGSKNPYTGEACSPNELSLQKIYDKYFYSSLIQSVLVNPSNYENPLNSDYVTKYKMLNYGFMKRDIVIIKEWMVNTDYGWIFETNKTHSMLGLDSIENDILNLDPETGTLQFETRIYFDKKQNSYFREYVKIQKLAAEVGGILKLFIAAAYFITEYFNGFYLNYALGNHFVTDEEMSNFHDYFNSRFHMYEKRRLSKSNFKGTNAIVNSQTLRDNMNNDNNVNDSEFNKVNKNFLSMDKKIKHSYILSKIDKIDSSNKITPDIPKINNKSNLIKNLSSNNMLDSSKSPIDKSDSNIGNNNLSGFNNKSKFINKNIFNSRDKNKNITNNSDIGNIDNILDINNDIINRNDAINDNYNNHDKINNNLISKSKNKENIINNSNSLIHTKNNNLFSNTKNKTNKSDDESLSITTTEQNDNIKMIDERIRYEKTKKQESKLMTVIDYLCISLPHMCKCQKSYESKYKAAVVKTTNGYLNTLISIETLIDSRFILNKLKDVLFNKEQVHLINYIPNRDFETYYKNIYNNNEKDMFDDRRNQLSRKQFILSLRRQLDNVTSNLESDCIYKVVKDAKYNPIDNRIVNAYKTK